jgi:hypothetical protein
MAETRTQGRRVDLIPQPGGFQSLAPGEYGKWTDGTWYGCTPNGHGGNLGGHEVIEHPDGTITVSPSISVTTTVDGKEIQVWHGYLEAGVWREC